MSLGSAFFPSKLATVAFRLGRLGSIRSLSFSFVGPKKLHDVIKPERVQDLTGREVADVWYTYHETKDGVVGLVLNGEDGSTVLLRATKSPFFIQPVFREDGYFTLISQFQGPSHFLLAYLEDYKMDPHAASPLLTFSVFDDYAQSKDITLVRCDILNKSIEVDEGRRVVHSLLESYRQTEDYVAVKTFNERPNSFDFDDLITRMKARWNSDDSINAHQDTPTSS